MRFWLLLLLTTFVGGPSAAQNVQPATLPKRLQSLLALTKDDFTSRIMLKDDDLETEARLSTLNGWQYKEGLLGVVNGDQFFRAFVDKKTGAVRFQVYQVVTYTAQRFARFFLVNFDAEGGPEQKELDVLSRLSGSCDRYTGCKREEHVAFFVDEALIRAVAAKYQPGRPGLWRFRLKAKSGAERDEGFSVAEVAAIVQAVDDYRGGKRFR